MPYKYKLKEMSKTASPEEAAKELRHKPGEDFAVGQVTYSDDGTRKSTITDINPVTGAVRWEITQLPGFDKLYDEMDDLVDVAKRVYVKTKDDKKFREFYEDARKLRNKIRTHLRNEYPDEYKNIVGINEEDVDEVSMSGAAGAYNTPYAFVRKPVKLKGKNKKKRYKYQMTKPSGLVGYMDNSVNEVIDLVHVYDKDGEIFGTGEIVQQFKDTAKVRFDGNFMGTFRNDRIKPVQESNDPGATLGPGPAAGPDGVTDSAYTKQFKYKLVPKNKNGTYVQKGSGLEVKKLF
tara:strand:- start:1917 stop:2789 length:873 start_codon:yes stop_codon:yes gene_type:complete